MATLTTRIASLTRSSLSRIIPLRFNSVSSVNISGGDQDSSSLSNQSNVYLPRHFYDFRRDDDIFKNYQEFIDKLKNSEDTLSRTELYVLIQKLELLLKLTKDHYVCYINYDKITRLHINYMISLREFYVLIKTMYDPGCVDGEEGFKHVWKNDSGFRENFVKKYGSDCLDEILPTFVKNSELRKKEYNVTVLRNYTESAHQLELYTSKRIFRNEKQTRNLDACLEGYNNSDYISDLLFKKCDEDISKSRQEYFMKEHQRFIVEAMNSKPYQSIPAFSTSSDKILDAYVTVDNICTTLQEKIEQYLKLHRAHFNSKGYRMTAKRLLDMFRSDCLPLCTDTKEGVKLTLQKDKTRLRYFSQRYGGNFEEDLPEFAEKFWNKVLKNDREFEIGMYGYEVEKDGFYTEDELRFLKCCADYFYIFFNEIPPKNSELYFDKLLPIY